MGTMRVLVIYLQAAHENKRVFTVNIAYTWHPLNVAYFILIIPLSSALAYSYVLCSCILIVCLLENLFSNWSHLLSKQKWSKTNQFKLFILGSNLLNWYSQRTKLTIKIRLKLNCWHWKQAGILLHIFGKFMILKYVDMYIFVFIILRYSLGKIF
jgi:hypothetical protein